jgi:hypothetical protein
VDAPATVLALVLAMTAVGGSVLLWFAPTWGNVRHGYEALTGGTLALIAWGAWGALRGPVRTLQAGDETVAEQAAMAGQASTLLLVLAIATGLAALALLVRVPPIVSRLLGAVATLAGLAAFVPLAGIRAERGGPGGWTQGIAELLLGSLLMGAIWVGMILGHWYLVERRLSNRYMVWMAWVNVAAVVAGLGSVLLSWRNSVPCSGLTGPAFEACARQFSPVLLIGSMTIVLGLGVLSLVALISGFNVKLAKEGGRSIQASTGMFYLAVILAPAVEFAAKVRFF